MAPRSGKLASSRARRWRGAALAAALVLTALSARAHAEEFLWPLPDAPRAMTGTFMEFREGRYHSGVDLRTQGREGLRVVAPADASVARLRSSANGYGIAVYLRLPDGRELVFAHLSALADRLRAPLLAAWRASGRYEQDLRLPPGTILVKRGELLALSGSTGVGAPHLHLELRDAAERPLNPLRYGFALPDSVAPRVVAARLVPLSPASTVEGAREALVLVPGASVAVAGSLGIMVEVSDRSGYAPFRLGPAEVSVELDGHEIYRLLNDSFAFSQTGQMRLERAVDPKNPKRSWLRLYRRPGNELPGRVADGPKGMSFALKPREQATLRLRVRDAAGNQGSAEFHLRGENPTPLGPKEAGRWAAYSREDAGPGRAGEILVGGVPTARPLRCALSPGDSLFLFDRGGSALYPGGVVWIEPAQGRLARPEGMRLEGAAWVLKSAGAVFREGLQLTLTTVKEKDATRRALFSFEPKHGWSFVAGPFDSTGTLHGTVEQPGHPGGMPRPLRSPAGRVPLERSPTPRAPDARRRPRRRASPPSGPDTSSLVGRRSLVERPRSGPWRGGPRHPTRRTALACTLGSGRRAGGVRILARPGFGKPSPDGSSPGPGGEPFATRDSPGFRLLRPISVTRLL